MRGEHSAGVAGQRRRHGRRAEAQRGCPAVGKGASGEGWYTRSRSARDGDARRRSVRGRRHGPDGAQDRGGGPSAQRRPAAAGAEDGGRGGSGRRCGARLQQFALRHLELFGVGAGRPRSGRPGARRHRRGTAGRPPCGRAHAPAPRLQPKADPRTAGDRPQRDRRGHREDAEAPTRRGHRSERGEGDVLAARARRPGPDRAGHHESRRKRA